MAYGVIYKITNQINGKNYVGQTTRTIKKRFVEHAKAKTCLGNAIRKHGKKNFTIEILEECETPEQLNEREIFWIARFNCKHPNGYNLTDGGENGWSHTEETCEKISAANKGRKLSQEHRAKIGAANSGKNNGFFGKHHTKEARTKMSLSHRGKKNHNFGKHQTADVSIKLSVANRSNSPYKNLISEMEKKKISYTALAKFLKLAQSTISRKLQGKVSIFVAQKKAIKKFLGVEMSVEELFKRDE